MIVLFVFFSLITQPTPVSSTLTISAQITDGNDITESFVERVLCVPANSRLELNCTTSGSDDVTWSTTADQIPGIRRYGTSAVAIIQNFKDVNIGVYTCSSENEMLDIYITMDEVAIVPNPQKYDVLESTNVVLSVCISAYPSYQSDLRLVWNYQGAGIPSCSFQGQAGCFECEVSAGDRFSSSNYSAAATARSYSASEDLTLTVHELPRLVSPLPPSMEVVQCKSAPLFCAATGDPGLKVVWKYKSSSGLVTLSSGGQHTITTSRGYESGEARYYTNSSLTINSVDEDTGGEYSCFFLGFMAISSSISSSSQLLVTPKLCIQKMVAGSIYLPVPGNSVELLEDIPPYVYVCFGQKVSWYRDNVLISTNASKDVYQYSSNYYGTLYLISPPPPGYFYCRSETDSLETWVYLTPTHPTLITRPSSGTLYFLRGSNVSIHANLSPPQGAYTLSWSYEFNGTQQDVTERGWSLTPLSEPGYYEASISLAGLEDMHTGIISAVYRTDGQVDTAILTVLTLPTPCLVLSPGDHLYLWEGSYIGVNCSLKNETVPITDSPKWEGVFGCPSEVCSDNSTLSLANITTSIEGNYTCSVGNEAGQKQKNLVVKVNPFSNELISLSYKLPNESIDRQSDTLYLSPSDYTNGDKLILSCSLNNSSFSTDYLRASDPIWKYDSSLSDSVRSLSSSSLSLDIISIFYRHQNTLLSADFCCETKLDIYREARQCIQLTFDVRDRTYPVPTPSTLPPPLHIVLLMFLDNCTLLASLDSIKLALLNLVRANCACNVSDTELHLTDYFCHTDLIDNHPYPVLTLCGASTDSLYQGILNASLAKPQILVEGHMLALEAVVQGYEETYCLLSTPSTLTTTNATQIPPLAYLPIWSKIVLFGALPMLMFMLLVVFCIVFLYLCCSRSCSTSYKEYGLQAGRTGGLTRMEELPGSEQTLQSDELLTSSMVMLSPSQVPQTFKTATSIGYPPQLSVPQELLSRPASTPPIQGEFPVMYSNPLAFDGSGEGYSTSFTNFNDNHTYYSDMPPISETAQRMPPVFATHRLMLNPNYSHFARDHAHSSLPSPLRTTKRNHHLQQRLSHARNSSFSPTDPYTHHQLKVAYRPSSVMRTETPTFDSGVEELDSIHPRSSSSASSSASEIRPARRIRSSSLATSFPQHVRHTRVHSIELSRNTSLPNITEASVNNFSSQGTKLELYKTVKQGQRESQTLV